MPEILTEYFTMLTTNLLSTLNTPDAYLNKIALSAVTIIIGLIIHILFKNIITRNTKSMQRRYNLQKILKKRKQIKGNYYRHWKKRIKKNG